MRDRQAEGALQGRRDIGQHDADEPARHASRAFSCGRIATAWLIGTANPMLLARELIAELMPTTSPARVDQRSAAVAEIDRGVGLDVVVEARVEQLPADEADDADRDRVHVAERIANRADPFADPQIVGVAERRLREVCRRPCTFSSATSMAGSAPTTWPRNARPSASVTVMRSAPSIT